MNFLRVRDLLLIFCVLVTCDFVLYLAGFKRGLDYGRQEISRESTNGSVPQTHEADDQREVAK